MKALALVAIGGATGSVARYLLAAWGTSLIAGGRFPLGTLLVNLLGCFLIGIFAGLGEKLQWLSPHLWLLLCTGLCGGFTTFSAFGLDLFNLLRAREWLLAGGYVSASFLGGLACLALGFMLVPTRGAFGG